MIYKKLAEIIASVLPCREGEFVPEKENAKAVRLVRPKGWETMENGIQGHLVFPSGYKIPTLERPWKNNEPNVSCIDCGMHDLIFRDSSLTKRLTKGNHEKTWEILDVEGRTDILVHIGNFVHNSLGCVLVGTSHGTDSEGMPTVWKSADAFEIFLEKMLTEEIEIIIIESEGEGE